MSVIAFGLEEWAQVGAAAICRRQERTRAPLCEVVQLTLSDVQIAVESNRRAFAARYGRSPVDCFDAVALAFAVGGALVSGSIAPPRLGGGLSYNCDEDPHFATVAGVVARLGEDACG